MTEQKMLKFHAEIEIIGINPFVFLPDDVLQNVFKQSGTDRGKIPVKMTIEGHEFRQTLIKYAGHWRLYLNTPMRKAAQKEVGDRATFEVRYDPAKREIPIPPKFKKALKENPDAKRVYDELAPSLRLEIVRYLSRLKTKESLDRNVARAINFLLGKERFIGRDELEN